MICLKHGLRADEEFVVEATAKALAKDPMALDLLRRTINVDDGFERVLTGVRRWLLMEYASAPAQLRGSLFELCCALALQCFSNEFVFFEGDDEARIAGDCLVSIELSTGERTSGDVATTVALAALYRPLTPLGCADALAERTDWPAPLDEVVKRALREPLEETRIEAAISTLTAVHDATSLEVKAQYEANPYPRWLDASHRPPESYAEFFKRRFPHFATPSRLEESVKVLVAGCGTGLEAINAAIGRTAARVTGVDLSRRSLAFAERMRRALGLDNLKLLQGDVLDLTARNSRFDIIECSGVLHHLADPIAGWRALTECLAEGGVMKVGLYSELARAPVVTARETIQQAGYVPDAAGIRAIRRRIFDASEDDPLAELVYSEDLYTTSACRDLLFHVREHRFRLADIGSALDLLGLRFVGFELPHPLIVTRYREFNPADGDMTDLEAWSRFEALDPETFAAMYVFWCHKPAEDGEC